MRPKYQRLLWLLILIYSIIETIDLISIHANDSLFYNTILPRTFVYFASRIDVFAREGKLILGVLWAHFFVNGGPLLLLLIPTFLFGVRGKNDQVVLIKRILNCDYFVLIGYCTVDFFGCIVSVSEEYHPLFSVLMDVFVIALTVWSLQTNNKHTSNI